MDKPWAMGLPTCPTRNTLKPNTAPNNPTTTTTAAVNEGIPPVAFDTSIAIGVVTDFGANEQMISGVAPNSLAMTTTVTNPTKHPANCE